MTSFLSSTSSPATSEHTAPCHVFPSYFLPLQPPTSVSFLSSRILTGTSDFLPFSSFSISHPLPYFSLDIPSLRSLFHQLIHCITSSSRFIFTDILPSTLLLSNPTSVTLSWPSILSPTLIISLLPHVHSPLCLISLFSWLFNRPLYSVS